MMETIATPKSDLIQKSVALIIHESTYKVKVK